MSEQKPEPVRTHEDEHGRVYTATCPNLHCRRQIAERQPGEARCVCGQKVELHS